MNVEVYLFIMWKCNLHCVFSFSSNIAEEHMMPLHPNISYSYLYTSIRIYLLFIQKYTYV